MAADGSIIIDTRIQTDGLSKGLNAIKAGMARISMQVSKMGDEAKNSFQKQITAITNLYQDYEKQERKVSELKAKLEELSKGIVRGYGEQALRDEAQAILDQISYLDDNFAKAVDMM